MGQEPFEFEHTDSRMSKVVTSMLRHGQAHTSFAMDALGHVTFAQVYEVLLNSDASLERKRGQRRLEMGDPRSLIGFLRTNTCRFFNFGTK